MAGYPCDIKKISDFCKKKKIVLIEDCAHALGTFFQGKVRSRLHGNSFFDVVRGIWSTAFSSKSELSPAREHFFKLFRTFSSFFEVRGTGGAAKLPRAGKSSQELAGPVCKFNIRYLKTPKDCIKTQECNPTSQGALR